MTVRPRPHLQSVELSAHGGPDYAELRQLGISPRELLDFSVNANPTQPPAELQGLLASADVTTYPDSESWRVREAAAETYGIQPEQVLAGNGSSELIWLICLAYVQPHNRVLVRQPTFGEYERAARIHGAEVATFSTPLPNEAAALAFICNPNNPTGDCLPPSELVDLAIGQPSTLFVLDEAYADFVAGRPTAIGAAMPDNLIVLRSLTKFSALAGLRLGLAFAQPPVVRALGKVKPPWNVNTLAQAAGAYAMHHRELLPDLNALATARQALVQGLGSLGLKPLPTACNFFLVPVDDAAETRRRLLARRCLVRDCSSFGLPDHIRIAVRTSEENCRLVDAFAAIL
ncbi:MAG TPA: aminotransferase class I/II-fold pyridoxal phosphate-dependent enzyme [Chloroflexota bacterium]|nr:aminotransferase class I/II-fold pyridoxal phosphate-dependent enzyme [Chloroflexota bacterium]